MSRPARKYNAGPLTIKKGSVSVKIYEGGDGRYVVVWREAGSRKRVTRFDFAEAKTLAKETAARLDDGKGTGLVLSGSAREGYLFAIRKLRGIEMELGPAVEEYLAAKKFGVSLAVAAEFYRDAHSTKLPDMTVEDVVTEFLTAKKTDGRSVRYLQDCKARLGRFSDDFRVQLKDVRTKDLDDWLRGLKSETKERPKLSPRTRNNFRTIICSLFSFARDSGYLRKGMPTEAEAAAIANEDEGEIEIFSPVEMAKLLSAAEDDVLPFLIFGGMAGLRSAEILRLKWEQVNWAESAVEVKGKVAKTGNRRLAPLIPAATAWLANFRQAKGPVVGHIKLYERLENLCEVAGVEWRQNALRHSFCSYRMAILKDAPRVSYEAGNSIRIIQRHYDKVVTESQGTAWFAIMPTALDNVVSMDAAVTA